MSDSNVLNSPNDGPDRSTVDTSASTFPESDHMSNRDLKIGIVAVLLALWGLAISGSSAMVVAVLVSPLIVFTGWLVARRRSIDDRTQRSLVTKMRRKLARQDSSQSRLEQNARQNASLLLQMVEGIVVLSPENEILLINSSARRLLGLRAVDDLVGRRFNDVIRIPEVIRALRRLPSVNRVQVVEAEISDPAAHDPANENPAEPYSGVRPVSIRADRLEVGDKSNVFLTIRDQTDEKRLERVRREFIANVSHELKTPLAAIKGYAETVEVAVEDDPKAALHFMSQIQVQCVRLENLIADMMELARAQAGRKQLKLERVSLFAAVKEAFEGNKPIASSRGIGLILESPRRTETVDGAIFDHAAMILGDRKAVVTIANNLIGNAIRYTPAGGEVRVQLIREGDLWMLSVQDDGPGIDPTEHERIFERFYRVEKTREANRGGTGLGLSIVKHLSIAQGGEVGLESQPGKGARFEVRLPAASAT